MLRQEQMPVGSNPTARHFFFLPFHSNTSAPAGGVVVCLSPSVYMRVLRQGQTLVGSNPAARHFFLLLFYPYICPGRRRYSLPIPPLKAIYVDALVGERTRRFKSGHPPFFQLSPFMKRPGRRHCSLLSPLKTIYAGRSLGGFSFLTQKDVEFTGSNPVAGALVEITTPADGPKVCPRNIEV